MPAPEFIKKFEPEQAGPKPEQLVREGLEAQEELANESNELEGQMGLSRLEYERTLEQLERTSAHIDQLREEMEELEGSMWRRITEGREKVALKEGIEKLAAKKEDLELNKVDFEAEEERRQVSLEEVRAAIDDMPQAASILTDFYDKKRERWANAEFDAEEVDKYFNAEFLAGLDIDEYVELLKRFPQQMVTHVSRNGVRDHVGLMEHRKGLDQYSSEFKSLLKAGAMNSAVGRTLVQEGAREMIAKDMGIEHAKSRKEAMEKVEQHVSQKGAWAQFGDFSAVHFAVEEVADYYYGAERENEAFVVYPSLFIASQHDFGGHYSDLDQKNDYDSTRNDVWVWQRELNGIDLDAGIVFLPKETPVGRESGSKFEIQNGEVVYDTENRKVIEDLVSHPRFRQVFTKVREALSAFWATHERHGIEKVADEQFEVASEALGVDRALFDMWFSDMRKNDFDLDRLAVLHQEGAEDPDSSSFWEYDAVIKDFLRRGNMLYQEASDAVPAQEYWEQYFEDHPDERPSKIVYYEGGDPTAALKKWRKDNGLMKKEDAEFYESFKKDHGDDAVKSRYLELAAQIIEETIPPAL
jgi:hypothetical protein